MCTRLFLGLRGYEANDNCELLYSTLFYSQNVIEATAPLNNLSARRKIRQCTRKFNQFSRKFFSAPKTPSAHQKILQFTRKILQQMKIFFSSQLLLLHLKRFFGTRKNSPAPQKKSSVSQKNFQHPRKYSTALGKIFS